MKRLLLYMSSQARSRSHSRTKSAALLAALVACLWSAGSAQEPAEPDRKPAEDARAAETFKRVCTTCHIADRVVSIRRTRTDWEEVITLMIAERGALVTDEDFDVVMAYLVKKHGRVHVNVANPEDIAEVLDIPLEMAETIVKHRRDVGKFKDLDALLKVPGVDRQKLDGKRDALLF